MHQWDPATDAEAAMRDALAAADQDRYFRILARSDLLLPVSAESLAGRAPMGWGTWTTANRTHVLAFTSPAALRLCLNEPAGSFRSVAFPALAAEWPNYEWWLAINPGLPIEAYLPSWFITQLVRGGEVRVPGRTAAGARARMAQSDLAAAISGRIRATGPGRTNAPPPAPAPQPPRAAAPPAAPIYSSSTALAARGYEPFDGYRQPGGYGYGQPESQGRTEPTQPAPTRVTARVGPTPVETVDAEILDTGTDRAYSPPGRDTAGRHGTAAPASPPPESTRESDQTTRFAYRDLGARLREYQGYTDGPSVRAEPPPPPAPAQPSSWTPRRGMIEDAEIVSPTEAWAVGFVPANETEAELLAATETNNTDSFLSTLLLARVILPVPISMPPGSRPRDKYFPWQIEEVDGERLIAVFTSPERLGDYGTGRFGPDMSTMSMRFIELIEAWPSPRIQFSINPDTPVGITLPGSQIVALAAWAAEVGLRNDSPGDIVVAARKHEAAPSMGVAGAPAVGAATAIIMQRTVPPAQLPFYLERGYDRVSGFVNRASEVAHLTTPRALYRALGLVYPGSPFAEDNAEVHVLRWVAHRPDLYRLPYGGQNETAMRAMQGWVIERPPFRGNGFAPGDTDVVAEFKVDSVRLPHGAQMWRLTRDGTETLVASFDADAGRWVRRTP
jgi:hypothetical protein